MVTFTNILRGFPSLTHGPLLPGPLTSAAGGICGPDLAENGIDALEAAIDGAADLVALDVRQCRDGTMIVFRDAGLSRMTATTGIVSAMSAPFLTRLQLRSGRGGPQARLTSAYVPLLNEALSMARDRIPVMLRLFRWADAEPVAALIEAADMAEQVMLRLPLGSVMEAGRAQSLTEDFGVRICPSIRFLPKTAEAQCDLVMSLAPPIVEIRGNGILEFPDLCARLRHESIAVSVSTARSGDWPGRAVTSIVGGADVRWAALADHGATVLETHQPEAMLQWRRQRAAA